MVYGGGTRRMRRMRRMRRGASPLHGFIFLYEFVLVAYRAACSIRRVRRGSVPPLWVYVFRV